MPTPLEQADDLILWIGGNQSDPSSPAVTTNHILSAMLGMPVRPDADDWQGLRWLLQQLKDRYLFTSYDNYPGIQLSFALEMPGWEKYEALKRRRIESRSAFMALKFGQTELDRVVDTCFRPAVARGGFELRILNDQQGAGLIDNQIRAAILSARFVISDLTHGSPGAYWEAGFGEGRGIPVIYTCEKAAWAQNKSHFDTNHMATIVWESDNLKKAEDALVAMIRATLRAEAKQTDD